MIADFEIEREGSVSLARRGAAGPGEFGRGADGAPQSLTLLESVPAEQMSLGLSWDAGDYLRLRLDVFDAGTVDGEEAWHIALRMPLSRAEAMGLMRFLAFALSQDGDG